MRSYECFVPRDTGKSTKRPAVSNDTGTPDGPHGTGAWPEGTVCLECAERARERGRCAERYQGDSSRRPVVSTDLSDLSGLSGLSALLGLSDLLGLPGLPGLSVHGTIHQGEDAHLMPDRSLRLFTLPPLPPPEGERAGVLWRERPGSPPDAPSDERAGDKKAGDGGSGQGGQDPRESPDDNPFAPPPEGTPDRPWQPRHPTGDDERRSGGGSRSPWGRQWSDRQPGRSSGGFGDRPGAPGPEGREGPDGPNGPGKGPGQGMRWDPTDPVQRRARYSLLTGMWAFFFALFGWPYVALLLGALALYWGISSLRATSRAGKDPAPDATGGSGTPAARTPANRAGTGTTPSGGSDTSRPQTTAAISGVVTASLALLYVAAVFTTQLVYSDYYTCVNDSLTNTAKQQCATQHLPENLRGVLGTDKG